MALATTDDIETSLMRELTQPEHKYAQALLERAEMLLVARIDDLQDRAKNEPSFKALVVATEAEAVARVFRNPDALRQESEGNYSYSVNFQVASGLLDILDIEWHRLGQIQTAGSIAPQTDGYITSRRGGRPDLAFQYDWPAYSDHSEGGEFTL